MSREDDFFGDYDESPDNAGGQEDTSEPMIESPAEPRPGPAAEEPTRPAAPRARPRPKKKAKTKTKLKAKKKPAPKKKATKKPAAKKKKTARPKPKK